MDRRRVEIALLSMGAFVLITEPGEVFSETAVWFRARAQLMGYGTVMLVSYTNDWLLHRTRLGRGSEHFAPFPAARPGAD